MINGEGATIQKYYNLQTKDRSINYKLYCVSPPFSFSSFFFHLGAKSQTESIKGKEVLEVGSGRGGGSSFMKRYLEPSRVVGADFSESQVKFCKSVSL